MKRLVCIVEGQGEVEAIPTLCSRILHWLGASAWVVDKQAICQPRTKLVDATVRGPGKPCKAAEMARILALAAARQPDAVLVLCDADDECPGVWAASVPRATHHGSPVAAVMAVREYEAWLLWSLSAADRSRIKVKDPELVRDAKGALGRAVGSYQPTIHQLSRTRAIDIEQVVASSRSFHKFVREVARLCGRPAPDLPTPGQRAAKSRAAGKR